MSDPFKTHGAFSWVELMTPKPQDAQKFYGALLGWTFKPMEMAKGGVYHVVQINGDQGIGGIMAPPPEAKGAPPHWGGYVTVDYVDATTAKVAKLGGKVHVPPTDIPNVGRFAVIADPQGAVLSIITYRMP